MAIDLEDRVEADARLGERLDRRPGEDRVTGPLAVRPAAARVHPADQLRVEPDAGGEREPAPIGTPESDAPRPPGCELPGGRDRIARQPENPWQDARPAARDEAEDSLRPRAVQRLVETAVA